MWNEFDDDNTGQLEKEEALRFLSVMLKDYTAQEPTESELEKHYTTMDTEQDGGVKKEDCLKYLRGL